MQDREAREQAIITPTDNGPYHVRGQFTIVLPSGQELTTDEEVWLCRCGGSQSKPFCDGTHERIGFRAAEADIAHAVAGQHDTGTVTADGARTVIAADALGEGDLLGVEVAGEPVVVGRVDGQVYAIGGICSHQYARLADGALDGEVVLCPLHNSGFNIKTGAAVRLPATDPVPTYAVAEEDGAIVIARVATPVQQER